MMADTLCDMAARLELRRARFRRTLEAFDAINGSTPVDEIRRIKADWQADMDAMGDPDDLLFTPWGTGGASTEREGERT